MSSRVADAGLETFARATRLREFVQDHALEVREHGVQNEMSSRPFDREDMSFNRANIATEVSASPNAIGHWRPNANGTLFAARFSSTRSEPEQQLS